MSSQEIFDAIEATLRPIVGLAVKFGPLAIVEPVLPIVAIVPEDEPATRTSKTSSATELTIMLRLLADSAENIEPWSQQIMAAMRSDPTLGGAARMCEFKTRGWSFYDPVFPQNGVKHHYVVTY